VSINRLELPACVTDRFHQAQPQAAAAAQLQATATSCRHELQSREQPQQAAAYCQRHKLLPSHAASYREPTPQTQVAVTSRRLKLTLQGYKPSSRIVALSHSLEPLLQANVASRHRVQPQMQATDKR